MRRRKQTATYWKAGGLDDFGNPSFEAPRTISVRWEDRGELFYDSEGRERRSQSMVGVGEDMSIGDYLQLGDNTSDLKPGSNAKEIKEFRRTPNLTNTKVDRWAVV